MKIMNLRKSIIILTFTFIFISVNSLDSKISLILAFLFSTHKILLGKKGLRSTNTNKSGEAPSGAPPASGAAPSGAAPSGGAPTNSTVVSKIVKESPYTISSCDQIIELNAQYLTDKNDFTKKSPAFFTISVYMVNQFDKRDGNTLQKSISMDKILTTPQIIPGSVSCIKFADTSLNEITICMPDKASALKIIEALDNILKCRIGDNLKNAPVGTINNILSASCLGLDVSYDVQKFGGDVNKAKAALQSAIKNALKNTSNNLKGTITPPKEETPAQNLDKVMGNKA